MMSPFSDAMHISDDVPDVLDIGSKIAKKPKVMDGINAYRAKICADMKNEHGEKFGSYDACMKFMKKACHPGKDGKMDGDSKEVSTQHGHCKVFFDDEEAEKEEEEDLAAKAKELAKKALAKARELADAKKERQRQREKEEERQREEDRKRQEEEKEKEKAMAIAKAKAKAKEKEREEKEAREKAGKKKPKVEEAIRDDNEEEKIVEEAEKVLDDDASPAPAPAVAAPKVVGASPAPAGSSPAGAGDRPTVGDTVEVLDTKHTQEKLPQGIGKTYVVKADLHNAQPYQLEGAPSTFPREWFYKDDVRLVKRKVHAPDEKWYYKNGGVDVGRYHMDESLKLPAQGYWGKLVEHEDGETSVADWQKEFTPSSGHGDRHPRRIICEKHPENIWCQERFGRDKKHKSSAPAPMIGHAMLALVLVFVCALGR